MYSTITYQWPLQFNKQNIKEPRCTISNSTLPVQDLVTSRGVQQQASNQDDHKKPQISNHVRPLNTAAIPPRLFQSTCLPCFLLVLIDITTLLPCLFLSRTVILLQIFLLFVLLLPLLLLLLLLLTPYLLILGLLCKPH